MMTFEKPDRIKFVLRTFTNEEIEALLEIGENFRDINIPARNKYAESMRQGWWDPCTGEAIAMDEEGRLVNGQHRLSAALIVQRETGKQIWFWVAQNVSDRSARSMDQGLSRKVLSYMEHEKAPLARFQAGIAAAVARRMLTRDEATLHSVCAYGSSQYSKHPSIGMVMDVWKRNRSAIQFWAEVASKIARAGLSRPTVLGSLLYHFAKQDEMRAKLFADLLIEGTGMKKGDPVFLLRERLRDEMRSKAKLNGVAVAALVVKAWVAWNEGRSVTCLKWTSVGPTAEAFPDHRYGAAS